MNIYHLNQISKDCYASQFYCVSIERDNEGVMMNVDITLTRQELEDLPTLNAFFDSGKWYCDLEYQPSKFTSEYIYLCRVGQAQCEAIESLLNNLEKECALKIQRDHLINLYPDDTSIQEMEGAFE